VEKYLGRLDLNDAGLPIVSSMGEFLIESGDYLVIWPRRGGASSVVFEGVVELSRGALSGASKEAWNDWLECNYEAELTKNMEHIQPHIK